MLGQSQPGMLFVGSMYWKSMAIVLRSVGLSFHTLRSRLRWSVRAGTGDAAADEADWLEEADGGRRAGGRGGAGGAGGSARAAALTGGELKEGARTSSGSCCPKNLRLG